MHHTHTDASLHTWIYFYSRFYQKFMWSTIKIDGIRFCIVCCERISVRIHAHIDTVIQRMRTKKATGHTTITTRTLFRMQQAIPTPPHTAHTYPYHPNYPDLRPMDNDPYWQWSKTIICILLCFKCVRDMRIRLTQGLYWQCSQKRVVLC